MSDINVVVPGVPPIYVNFTPGYVGQSGYSGVGFVNGVVFTIMLSPSGS